MSSHKMGQEVGIVMGFDLLGTHFDLILRLTPQSWIIWLAQSIIALFFMAGFLSYYQKLYRYAFVEEHPHAQQLGVRIGILVMSVGTAVVLQVIGYLMIHSALMFHNIALFLFLLPFLNSSLGKFENGMRLVMLIGFWLLSHIGFYGRPQFWISVGLLAVGVVIMLRYAPAIRANFWMSTAITTYVAVVYWGLLPIAGSTAIQLRIMLRAVLMFFVMALVAFLFWRAEAQAAQKSVKLQKLANYDQLTNAKTYSLYQHDVTNMFNKAREEGVPLTLVGLDIDHFKQINDHYGHLAGNAVLIGAASKLGEVLSRYDRSYQLYRTGGEEFNAVFYGQEPQEVLPVITECWQAIRKEKFTYGDYDVAISLSAGITQMSADDRGIDDLYKRADDNLYLSKHAGRDTITVEGETLHSQNEQGLIATYTFFTQGIMHVTRADDIDGAQRQTNELLLRMYDHEHERWVLPDMFEISSNTQLDLVKRVLAQSSARSVALNLTQSQFCDPTLARALTEFKNSQEGPDELTVEITEVPDMMTTRSITAIYRASDVKINIDDVGSDNSYELVHDLLPYVDGVKFALQNLRQNNNAETLRERVRFWAQVAQENQLRFILEGVENASEIRQAYEHLGIEFFQGYYFNKPNLPAL